MNMFKSLLAVTVAFSVSGCIPKLHDDLVKMDEATDVYIGTASASDFDPNQLIVVALRDVQGSQVAAFRVLDGPGPYEINATSESVWLFAFDDLNNDLRYQQGEPCGWANSGQAIIDDDSNSGQLDIKLSLATHKPSRVPDGLIDVQLVSSISDIASIQIGTITTLDNGLFSEDQASKGVSQPYQFMVDGTAGVFFLEAYDPNRIPVLFVHGINDSPKRFKAMIESLDKSRFQAWLFSYPSGLDISTAANGLHNILNILHGHSSTEFDQLHIIAHSMGGLVSRGAINHCIPSRSCDYLRSYITLSTPWNGVDSAKKGVEAFKTPVPAWRQLDPSSEYVTTLFDTALPRNASFSLLFGFQQDSMFSTQSSDGVILLKSQLRAVAQQQSSLMRGYDESHTSIVSSPAVIAQVNEILNAQSR